jgi:hypothetical protein
MQPMEPAMPTLFEHEHSALQEFCAASPFAVSTARMTELRDRERLIAREIARDAVPL